MKITNYRNIENGQKTRWDSVKIDEYENWRSERRTLFFDELYINNLIGKSYLDVGCGAGHLYEKLKHTNPDAAFWGIDLSQNMINYCHERGFINARLGSGNNLEFPDEMFDIVYAATWVMKYPDVDRALTEMNRVLKPNGLLAFDLPFLLGHGLCTMIRLLKTPPNLWLRRLKGAYLHLDGIWYPAWQKKLRKNGFVVLDVVGGIDLPLRGGMYSFRKPVRSFLGLMCSSIIWFLARKAN